MTDVNTYHSAVSSIGSSGTMDEFFSCDEDDDDEQPLQLLGQLRSNLEPRAKSNTVRGLDPAWRGTDEISV